MIHFGHGQLAHGVLGVFRVTAAKVDIFDVAHLEPKDARGRRGERRGAKLRASCFGRFLRGNFVVI